MTDKILLFNRWDLSEVVVEDPGLKNHINIKPIIITRTGGMYAPKPFLKEKISIVESFTNKLLV